MSKERTENINIYTTMIGHILALVILVPLCAIYRFYVAQSITIFPQKLCGSEENNFTDYNSQGNEITYNVAVCAYTTSKYCDSVATNDVILNAFREGSLWAKRSGMSMFCINMDHGSDWSAEIRVIQRDNNERNYRNYRNIWGIHCPVDSNWRPQQAD